MPSTTLKLEVNIPVRLTVSGAAIWPGKEWQGKQLPAQLALKGTIGAGSDIVTVYVPNELGAVLKAAGASTREIESKGVKALAFDLPANRKVWEICKRQAAGDKHPHTELYEPGEREPLTEVPRPLTAPKEEMPWEAPKTAPSASQTHEPPKGGESASQRLYRDTFEWVMSLVRPYLDDEDPEVVFTGQDVAAMTATVYIQRNKLGEIPTSRNPEAK